MTPASIEWDAQWHTHKLEMGNPDASFPLINANLSDEELKQLYELLKEYIERV